MPTPIFIFTDILEAQLDTAEYKKTVLIIAERLEIRGKNKRVSGHKKKGEEKGGTFLLTMIPKTNIFFKGLFYQIHDE